MLIEEIFGKEITNIYATFGEEDEWLDTADCFIELEYNLIIGFPNGFQSEVWIREMEPNTENILQDLKDYKYYHVNKAGKTINEIQTLVEKRNKNYFYKILKVIWTDNPFFAAYKPYKIEKVKNNAKNIANSKIVDFLWYDNDFRKGYFLLDNGYLITETTMSPKGTGRAGLNYYTSFTEFTELFGSDYTKLTDTNKGSR